MITHGCSIIDFILGLRGWFLGWYRLMMPCVFLKWCYYRILVCVLVDISDDFNVRQLQTGLFS